MTGAKKGKDDYHGYCNFRAIDIKCDNSGKAQLLQHYTKVATTIYNKIQDDGIQVDKMLTLFGMDKM